MDKPRPTGSQWDVYAEQIRVQLPAAPEGLLNGYVRWMPWLAIIFGALGILFSVVLGPLLAIVSIFSASSGGFLAIIVIFIASVLSIIGGIMMRQFRLTGWWLLAVGIILNALNSLLTLNIIALLFAVAIAYVHLLVKPRYIAG